MQYWKQPKPTIDGSNLNKYQNAILILLYQEFPKSYRYLLNTPHVIYGNTTGNKLLDNFYDIKDSITSINFLNKIEDLEVDFSLNLFNQQTETPLPQTEDDLDKPALFSFTNDEDEYSERNYLWEDELIEKKRIQKQAIKDKMDVWKSKCHTPEAIIMDSDPYLQTGRKKIKLELIQEVYNQKRDIITSALRMNDLEQKTYDVVKSIFFFENKKKELSYKDLQQRIKINDAYLFVLEKGGFPSGDLSFSDFSILYEKLNEKVLPKESLNEVKKDLTELTQTNKPLKQQITSFLNFCKKHPDDKQLQTAGLFYINSFQISCGQPTIKITENFFNRKELNNLSEFRINKILKDSIKPYSKFYKKAIKRTI